MFGQSLRSPCTISIVGLVAVGLGLTQSVAAECHYGTFMVWDSNRTGMQAIWKMHPDGSDKHQLTDDAAHDVTPAISPDGSEIAFSSYRGGGNSTIWLMGCDGSNQRPIAAVSGFNAQYPSWSPDGQRIVFGAVIGASSGGIYIVDKDGSNLQRLTSGYDSRPTFSPDGLKIWFDHRMTSASYSGQLFCMNVDGSNVQQCTVGPDYNEDTVTACGDVSPDGTLITFMRGHGIWIADADCGNVMSTAVELFDGSYPSNRYNEPRFSPDGGWLIFAHALDIFICRLDGSELTQLTVHPDSDERGSWGVIGCPPNPCPADINGDGVVDQADLGELLSVYGEDCD
jgi:Tol biopolymer transport system component